MKNITQKIKKWFHTKDGVEQQEINKQLVIIVSSIMLTVISVLGVTYSAFVWSDNSLKEQSLVAGNIALDISSNSSSLGSDLNYPVAKKDEDSLTPYTFTITNNGNLEATYKIKIVSDDTYTNTLDTQYIYMSLDGANVINRSPLSNYNNRAIDQGVLAPGASKTYDLRLWIIENAPNSVIGQEWHGKILLETGQTVEGEANPPILATGMIPVTYDDTNDVWVKADADTTDWYNYDEQMWANAVTVSTKGDLNQDREIEEAECSIVLEALHASDDSYFTTNTEMIEYLTAIGLYDTSTSSLSISVEELLNRADINGSGEVDIADGALCQKRIGINYYESVDVGTTIPMHEINSMWVWIPRFKYKITTGLGSSSALTNPPQIDVIFEGGTTASGASESTYRTGIGSDGTNTNYYTHPAFRNIENIEYSDESPSKGAWDEEITGFWVGKFETGTTNETCISTPIASNCLNVNPIIKPDVQSLRYQTVSTEFLTSIKFAGGTMDTSTGSVTFSGNDTYGLTSVVDTHMMKNTEWGAVAILSQSEYGKMGNSNYTDSNKEVYLNNSYKHITGRSLGAPSPLTDSTTTYGTYSYNDYTCSTTDSSCTGNKVTNAGQGASTTGNVYGIYDMSGNSDEYVMGNWDDTILKDGFTILPNSKYYDLYNGTSSEDTTINKSILGDATWETMNWYSDYADFVYSSYNWFLRGGRFSYTTDAGLFLFFGYNGDSSMYYSFRTVLMP